MQRDAEQRRGQIVEAAYAIVSEGGAGALTAQAVTKAVGVSRPLLYHYFDTMDALLGVVVDQYVDQFETIADEWAAGARTSSEPLRDIVSSAVRAMRPALVDACPLAGSIDQICPAYMGYLSRCANKIASLIRDGEGPLARAMRETQLNSSELANMLVFGACGTAMTSPDVSSESLADIILLTATPAARETVPMTEAPPVEQPPVKTGLFQRIFGGR